MSSPTKMKTASTAEKAASIRPRQPQRRSDRRRLKHTQQVSGAARGPRSEGARDPGSQGGKEPWSEGARDPGSQGVKGPETQGARE